MFVRRRLLVPIEMVPDRANGVFYIEKGCRLVRQLWNLCAPEPEGCFAFYDVALRGKRVVEHVGDGLEIAPCFVEVSRGELKVSQIVEDRW